jgi:FKBP-type peptidyl-prolyl cis-trans isomerase FklB
MRIQTLALVCAVAAFSTFAAQAQDAAKPVTPQPAAGDKSPGPKFSAKQKISYGLGNNIGGSLKQVGLAADDLDINVLVRAIADVLNSQETALSASEIDDAMGEFRKMLTAKSKAKAAAAVKENIAEGEKFLAANKKKPGVKTTKSGLQYEIIQSGNGPTPTKSDTVTTHYKGQLINGEIFDGSYRGKAPGDGDEPISFPVGGVIAGWTEALQLMKVGDKWRLFIPSELAYGERGAGADIGPWATLIFEIELIAIK